MQHDVLLKTGAVQRRFILYALTIMPPGLTAVLLVVRRFMVFLRRLRFLRYCQFSSGFMVFLRRTGFLLSSRFPVAALWCFFAACAFCSAPVSRPLCDVFLW